MNDDQRAAVMMGRLGLLAVAGLLVLVSGIAHTSVPALVGGVLALVSSLAMMDSFTHRRSGAATLPPIVGLGVSLFGAGIGLFVPWTDVTVVFGVALVVWLGQVVWNFPKTQKRVRSEVADALRQQSAFPPKGT